MEQRFYKVRLVTGRVIGPIELDRIKVFITKDKITGLEMARLYPTGEWKDINTFPEIAELLMQRLEGKLAPESGSSAAPLAPAQADAKPGEAASMSISLEMSKGAVDQPSLMSATATAKATPGAPGAGDTTLPKDRTIPMGDADATKVMTADDERTILYSNGDQQAAAQPPVPLDADGVAGSSVDPKTANEKTQMLSIPAAVQARQKKLGKRRKVFLGVAVAIVLLLLAAPDNGKQAPHDREAVFHVQMPTPLTPDPQQSEKVYREALPIYAQDTVEGYKKAAKLFHKAASLDSNNVKALCFLASSYMNLIDVLPRNENYLNVVTRLIELERAKGVDLPETVIADVELYLMLGNSDAAIGRLVAYLNNHAWDAVLLYYLAASFHQKGHYPEAMRHLSTIERRDYFSPKVNYLMGLLHERGNQFDEAIKAFEEAVARSPKHIAARLKLTELYFGKDNFQEVGKHVDFVIFNSDQASRAQLGKAYYYRARLHQIASRDAEAAEDLEAALKANPADSDALLELYTVKARLGAKVGGDASNKAKMFHFLALGEKHLRDGLLDLALTAFLNAREAQFADPTPLLRMAEVFKRKGDIQSAAASLGKAVQAAPRKPDIYPKYIEALTEAFEFEEASRVINTYKELSPSIGLLDRLQGDLYVKLDKPNEALAYYKRALTSSNADPAVYIAYANIMLKDGKYQDASLYFGLAQRFDPFNVAATVGIGRAFAEMEGVERGVKYVEDALLNSPYKPALLNGIAEIYLQKGDYTAALKYAQNALTTDSKFALAYKTRGTALAAQERDKEALDAFLTYTNLATLDPSGHIERYKIFLKKLNLKAAKEELQQVLKAYPKYPGAWFMMGEVYRIAQDFDSALKAAETEIKFNPNHVPSYVLAGTAFNMAKDYTKALQHLNRALALNPNYVAALLQAGMANQELKTYPAAQTFYERALALDPGNPQVHRQLASLYQELGNEGKMREHIRSYLDLYPDAPDRKSLERYL